MIFYMMHESSHDISQISGMILRDIVGSGKFTLKVPQTHVLL